MPSNRNRVLCLILPILALGLLLLCGLTGCTMGMKTKPTSGLDETQAQLQARDSTAGLDKENAELREKVAKLERDNEALQKKVKLLETLFRDVLHWYPPGDQPAISAVVQTIENDLQFVMLSVGRDDEVTKGMRFFISRNGSYVGEVQVDYVYPKSCSASYVRLKPGMSFQVGDTATTRL
jgi:cell division protein FtsB